MGRHSKAAKLVGGVRGGRALLDDDERRRAIEAGERDIDDGVGFLRYGSARHGVDGRVRRRVQGPFQGRDRPRPGDERHAGTGNPRRAPRRDTRHRQTGEGRGRRARPRGTRVRDGAPNPPHRPRAAGHRNGPKPGITRTKRRKPSHYKDGTKIKPLQHSCASSLGYTSLEEEDSILAGENVNKHRDWRFELLRIIAMFLIVATHFYAADNWSIHTDPNLSRTWASAAHDSLAMFGQIGVSFFILISAYFLAFNKKKPIPRLIRLWIQIFIYSAGIFVIYALLRRTPLIPTNLREEISPNMVLTSFFPITFNAYWFMSAFCVLILLAPFITILFDQLSKRQTLVLISIMFWMTFVWKLLNPTNQYFTDVIYLTTIFMIGSFIRRYASEFPKIKIWHLFITIILGFFVCISCTYFIKSEAFLSEYYNANILTAGPGASPIIPVIIATVIFIRIVQREQKQAPKLLANFILCVSPATFGVYLIHENFLFKQILWHYIFLIPESSGSLKIIISIFIIILLYAALMTLSWIILNVLINPLTRKLIHR